MSDGRMSGNNELERILKEAVVAIARNFPGVNEENHKNHQAG